MTKHDLVDVNAQFNACVYAPEVGDDWTPAVIGGGADCDSYATAKFQALVDRGWPVSALRLATCWVEDNGGYHCVLLANLDGTTHVLDNRFPYPMHYDMLPYKWHKLQIAGTQKWELA